MRRFIILGLVAVVSAVVAGGLVVRSRQEASAYHNNQIQVGDINDDGVINFPIDVISLAKIAFGLQPAPTPYVIPVPTATPTSYCNLSGRTLTYFGNGHLINGLDLSHCLFIGTVFPAGSNISDNLFTMV